jgi:hypothetical protein
MTGCRRSDAHQQDLVSLSVQAHGVIEWYIDKRKAKSLIMAAHFRRTQPDLTHHSGRDSQYATYDDYA